MHEGAEMAGGREAWVPSMVGGGETWVPSMAKMEVDLLPWRAVEKPGWLPWWTVGVLMVWLELPCILVPCGTEVS